MKSPVKSFAEPGHHYAFVLLHSGLWCNQGMVPDNNRAPFVKEWTQGATLHGKYVKPKGSRVAFVPFCFQGSNIMSDSDIYSFATHTE